MGLFRNIRRRAPALPAEPLPFDDTVVQPSRTIEIFDDDRDFVADDPREIYFFDGKSILPIGGRRNRQDIGLYSGAGQGALSTRRTLRHNDYDYALAATQCEYAFRCANIIADDIAGIPSSVRNKRTKQELPEHPLMQAFTWARIDYRQNIIRLWEVARMIFGEVYIRPEANAFGYYTGMRWLNPLATEPYIMYGKIEYFEYAVDNGLFQLRPNEVVFDRFDWILDDIRGQSLIAAALDAINIDREVKRFTLDSLLKDMRMQGILTGRQGSNVSEAELKAVKNTLQEQKNSRLIAISPALEYKPVQHEWNGAQLQVSDDVRRRVTAALGIPMSTAGAWDDAKYQSAPEQRRHYLENVVLRETNRHAQVVNDVLLPFYDYSGEVEFYYDTSELMGLIEDKAAKDDMYGKRVQSSRATINEARVAVGDEPLPGGDVILIPSGMIAVPVDQLGQYAQQQATQPPALPAPTPTAALPVEDADKALEAPTADVTPPGAKSGCLLLTLPNNPDLIALQGHAMRLVGDVPCKWEAPADFHLTLVYMPIITDEQAAALAAELPSIEVPEMKLRVGSLAVFDNVGEHALHYKVRRSGAQVLYDLQAALYDLCAELGIPISSHHLPEQYDPHITMGYASQPFPRTTYRGRDMVSPVELRFTVGKEHEVIYSAPVGSVPMVAKAVSELMPEPPAVDMDAIWAKVEAKLAESVPTGKAALLFQQDVNYTVQSPHPAQFCRNCRWFSDQPNTAPCHLVVNGGPLTIVEGGYCDRWEIIPDGSTVNAFVEDQMPGNPNRVTADTDDVKGQDTAEDELKAWRKHALNKGAAKSAAGFETKLLPEVVAEFIRGELSALGTDATKSFINGVFDDVEQLLGRKAYSSTRANFKEGVLALIEAARANETKRKAWASDMRTLARRSGLDTVFDAFADAENPIESLSQSMLTIFRAWQAETSDYITNFGSELFKEGGISDAEVPIRVDMWGNKSLDDLYYTAFREAGATIEAVWKLGSTEKHCDTCKSRDGEAKTVDEWGKIGFPRDRRLDCGGWQCDCDLFNKKTGKRIGAR